MNMEDAGWMAFQSRVHESRFALRCSVTTIWSMNDSSIGWRSLYFALTSSAVVAIRP